MYSAFVELEELPIYRLDIVEDLESNVEVDFVALVDRPAIEKSFLAFQDSYSLSSPLPSLLVLCSSLDLERVLLLGS